LKKNGYRDVEFTGLKEWKDQGLPLVYPKKPE